MKFSVANINAGQVRSEFMLSVFNLANEERKRRAEIDAPVPRAVFNTFHAEKRHGPYLDDGRNMCVETFIHHTDSDYLLFIDSDIEFEVNQPYALIETMIEQGVTVATGVYYSPNVHSLVKGITPVIYQWGPNPHMKNLDDPSTLVQDLIPLTVDQLDSFTPGNKLHPIDSCGAGFLAIHRSVFHDVSSHQPRGYPAPWFGTAVIEGIHMHEDHVFCIRAAAVGHQPHVLPCLELRHMKLFVCFPDRSQPSTL